jgi:hypothetical protein
MTNSEVSVLPFSERAKVAAGLAKGWRAPERGETTV